MNKCIVKVSVCHFSLSVKASQLTPWGFRVECPTAIWWWLMITIITFQLLK